MEVRIHFIGDTRMKRLNIDYRGKNSSTDVLSFSLQEGEAVLDASDLGDIFLSPAYIRRQARRFDVSFREECTRMMIHGILHLLGYDHMKPGDAEEMFGLQEKILKKCV